MRKYLLIITLIIVLFLPTSVNSQTETPSDFSEQIDELQSKIASKVASLNLVEKRGIIGIVQDASDSQITITDLGGNTRIIDVDELTKFSSDSSKSYGISDVKKADEIGVLGIFNKQSKRILARLISQQSPFPKIVYGKIDSVDRQNFEITISKSNMQKVVVEIEDITKSYVFENSELTRFGFSKMSHDQTIIAIGNNDKQDPNKILGSRIIVLSEINLGTDPDKKPTIPPSTGSGVKLFPKGTN